jgi:phosphinothricin acetyltransferase
MAGEKDASAILNIYAPFIINTAITFEYDLPTVSEFAERIDKISKNYPWLVCVNENELAGYAYGCAHRERKAYQWSAEVSVYVAENYRRSGIAKKLYHTLFELCRLQNIVNLYAGIVLPNEQSEKFHRNCGFRDVGIYKKIGYKLGGWHNVLWMHLAINDPPDFPDPLIPFTQIESKACEEVLMKANSGWLLPSG